MKTLLSFLTIIAAVLLTGCATTSPPHDYSGVPPTEIVATVSCSDPSIPFTGTIIADGHTKHYSGTGSGTFHATGHEFVCSFKKTGKDGQISISVSEKGENKGNAYTSIQFGGVRAEFVRNRHEYHDTFSTF
jgi:hypothetical protein